MKNIDSKIRNAFEHATPNVLASVLSDCKMQKGTVRNMTNKKTNRIKNIAATAAAFALLIGVCAAAVGFLGSGFRHGAANQPDGGDVNQNTPIQTAPADQYIGKDAAKKIAFDDAMANHPGYIGNITYMDARAELDTEDGKTIYEVVLRIDSTEYEYEIDAITGKILDMDRDHDDIGEIPAEPDITRDAAVDIALKHAGTTKDAVTDLDAELDDDGKYDISFDFDGQEYDYEIDAITGEILKAETEGHDDFNDKDVSGGIVVQPPTGTIGKEKALIIAFQNAGTTLDQVSWLECEFDGSNYEIAFDYNGLDYEYYIAVTTGDIVYMSTEPNDDSMMDTGITSVDIVLETALTDAGMTLYDITNLEIDTEDSDDYPHPVYEISFVHNNQAELLGYEYKISMYTGEIFDAEKEIVD